MIASVLGVLSVGGLGACDKADEQATEVPAATQTGKTDGECLHTEGCCGGHTEGDGSCGAAKAEAAKAEAATPDAGKEAAALPKRFEWMVEPGRFAEINVELADGATMTAAYEADGIVAWNVHSHPDDKPKIHAEGDAAKGTQAFAADKGGLYSYIWVNKGKQAVKLTVDLSFEGTGRVHSTHPETP